MLSALRMIESQMNFLFIYLSLEKPTQRSMFPYAVIYICIALFWLAQVLQQQQDPCTEQSRHHSVTTELTQKSGRMNGGCESESSLQITATVGGLKHLRLCIVFANCKKLCMVKQWLGNGISCPSGLQLNLTLQVRLY